MEKIMRDRNGRLVYVIVADQKRALRREAADGHGYYG